MDLYADICTQIDDVNADEWNCLNVDNDPFLRHEFLSALERHNAVGERFGWLVNHVLVRDHRGVLVGAMPMYEKNNSYGELVFDWAWADAYARQGGRYYPKLVVAIPYTPATGKRFLVAQDVFDQGAVRDRLLEKALSFAKTRGMSSLHLLFTDERDTVCAVNKGLSLRVNCQFHWHNENYESFDGFLSRLSSRKRKQIRRERQRVREAGIELRHFHGDEMTDELWAHWHRFYRSTFERKSGAATLSEAFFKELGKTMGESVLVVLAYDQENPVAGALMYQSANTLYGRHWGCDAAYHSLHFEACYYYGQEYAIAHGLLRFDPGAQGEHKISRGFLPTSTYSAHWIADPQFADAVDRFVRHEHEMINDYMNELSQHVPFRKETMSKHCGEELLSQKD